MKKCIKGKSCRESCINKGKKCSVTLSASVSQSLARITDSLKSEYKPERYKGWEPKAKGFYGVVSFSPDEKRVVKELISRGDGKDKFGEYEVEVAVRMGNLGSSPKVISHSSKHIEMERAKGKPLWEGYQQQEGDMPMNSRQSLNSSKALKNLHKMGFFHGDIHNLQFIVDKDNVKLIDFGASAPFETNPRKLIQDLNKASKFIDWDNPDLDGDLYVQTVRKYRSMYRNPPSRKKQDVLDHENLTGMQYQKELSLLP